MSAKIKQTWKFHRNMWFWLKLSICQSSMVHGGCWVNCPTKVGNLVESTVCWTEATRRVQLSRNQAAVDRVCRVAVKDRPCAQSGGQAKKAYMYVSLLDFAWNCHSLFKCIQKNKFIVISSSHASTDVVLSCCLKPIVSPISLTDKQRYHLLSCYCSIIKSKLYNK